MFARKGSIVKRKVPEGTYEIRVASGDKWYGERDLFGSSTYVKKNPNPTQFEVIPTYNGYEYTVYTLKMIESVDGNLNMTQMRVEDF